MKTIQYILRYTFVLGVTLSMAFVLGPRLIKKALNPIEKRANTVEIQSIDVSYLNESATRYIKAIYTFDNKSYKEIYFLPENKHKKLEAFLCKFNLIDNPNTSICLLNKTTIPVKLTQEELSKLPEARVNLDKGNNIKFLQIGEVVIIGKASTLLGKILLIILAVIFFVWGVLLLIAATAYTLNNLKIYRRTGVLPSPPNTIDEMKKGFKLMFGRKI